MSIRSNGQVIAKDGNFIIKKPDGLYKAPPQKNKPLAPDTKKEVKMQSIPGVDEAYKHPDAHIPLSEWEKWESWHKPNKLDKS